MEEFGFLECHFLDFEVFLGCLSFDEVGCEGVGTSDESEDGGFRAYFLAEGAECFGDEGGCGGRIDGVHLERDWRLEESERVF